MEWGGGQHPGEIFTMQDQESVCLLIKDFCPKQQWQVLGKEGWGVFPQAVNPRRATCSPDGERRPTLRVRNQNATLKSDVTLLAFQVSVRENVHGPGPVGTHSRCPDSGRPAMQHGSNCVDQVMVNRSETDEVRSVKQ